MKRSRGYLSGNTRKLKTKERISATRIIKDFKIGDKVIIDVYPQYKGGLPHPRYKGRAGIIKEVRGSHYVVEIKDGKKPKELICHPVHLKRIEKEVR